MTITDKHKMSHYLLYESVFSLDKRFEEKVRAYDVAKEIDGVKVKSIMEIQFQHIIMAWNIQTQLDLFNVTCKAYGLDIEKVDSFPMIDFLRLTFTIADTSKLAGDIFKKLKRETKDAQVKDILSKFTTNNPTAILAEIMVASKGAYTQEQAGQLPWKLAYDIIEMQTIQYDKETAIAELQEKRMKENGTKHRR